MIMISDALIALWNIWLQTYLYTTFLTTYLIMYNLENHQCETICIITFLIIFYSRVYKHCTKTFNWKMREQLKSYLENTLDSHIDSWETYLYETDQHYTRNSFLKKHKKIIQSLLEEIRDERQVDLNSSFSSVSTLIMDIDE